MSTGPQRRYTEAEYLAIERDVETKHEYYRGEMFAMSGASRQHNRITVNISALFHDQLKNRKCEHFINDMRVKVEASSLYTYPDVVITCHEPRFLDQNVDTLLNPQVIIEVLSDSTEKYDRGKKFEQYRTIPSLREYVLISQDRAHIDRFALNEQGQWVLNDASGLDAVIELVTIGCRLPLAEVYAKVEFDPTPDPAPLPADSKFSSR
jgi:Uma2 family endonuclease